MDILALIISILSAVGTCVAAYFSFRANRPKIKIDISSYCCFSAEKKYSYVYVEFYNISPATETISRISLITKSGKVYHCKNITEKQDTQFLQFSNQDDFEVDTDKILLITPIVLKPYSFTFGCAIFFNSVLTDGEIAALQFERVSCFNHPITKAVFVRRNSDDEQSD